MKPKEVVLLPEGSWGEKNNHDVWSNESTKWVWEANYNDEFRLNNIMEKYPIQTQSPLQKRILTQALRELMLLQSSDWPFLIYTQSARDYAEQRFSYHHSDFNRLCDLSEKYSSNSDIISNDLKFIEDVEKRNSIFPELQLEWWV
jgi:1,4-alpha-glucan branching enzyme